jgi:anhydro-N-acetylmuramic acid kinase
MLSEFKKSWQKSRSRQILVLSAGTLHSGVQGVFIDIEDAGWAVGAHSFVPYPAGLQEFIESMLNGGGPLSLAELAAHDRRLSFCIAECAKNVLAQVPETHKSPYCAIVNTLPLYKTPAGAQERWCLELGDPHAAAMALKVPVLTGFLRHGLLRDGPGELPLADGHRAIAAKASGDFVIANVGILSRMTIVLASDKKVSIDSDIGPGALLLNLAARECGCSEGFDRDGTVALAGTVHDAALEALMSHEFFSAPFPRDATLAMFRKLYTHESLAQLTPQDRLATLTAFSARVIFDCVRREYKDHSGLNAIWIAGGGAYNQTLIKYLEVWFGAGKIKTTVELGIPPEAYIPTALGLAVAAYLDDSGKEAREAGFGEWVLA